MTDKDKSQFDELSFEKQKELFFKSSYTERGDLLLRSQDPALLANSLSCEEMYLVTRDMDMDLRAEILKYANLPQLFFMSDLDCWKKDRIHSKGFLDWLQCLAQADLDKLGEWLARMDYEMVVAGFQHFIEVVKPEWEYVSDEQLGDKPYFTLDGFYYILVNEDNVETVRLAIEILFQHAHHEYVNLMEGLLSEMEYEMEEEAYRHRQMRLSERGFPELESAQQIYRRLSEEEWQKLPKKNGSAGRPIRDDSEMILPNYPVLWSKERLFLDDVLLNLSKEPVETLHAIQDELVWLSNKVLACEGIELASEEKVRHGIERVRRYVNIGLEDASGSQVEAAQKIVKEYWLEFLFRRGFTALTKVRDDVEKLIRDYWRGRKEHFFNFLGEPFENAARGMLRRDPLFYDPEESGNLDQLRDFKCLAEVRETARLVTALAGMHAMLSRNFPKIFSVLGVEFERDGESTPLVELVGTLLAQFALTGSPAYREVARKDIALFVERAFETNALRPKIISGFMVSLLNGKKDEVLESFLHQLLARVEQDFRGLSGKKAIDPRYINTVKVK